MLTAKTIIIALGAVVVVAGGAFLISRNSSHTSPTDLVPSNATTTAAAADASASASGAGKKIPFSELVKQGGAYSCTVHQYVANTDTQGSVYISGGNMRGEFSTAVQGMTIGTSFIVRDGYSYTWSSLAPTRGFKVAVAKSAAQGDSSAPASGTFSFNADQIGDYNCVAWTPDASKFAIPSSVTFTAVGQK